MRDHTHHRRPPARVAVALDDISADVGPHVRLLAMLRRRKFACVRADSVQGAAAIELAAAGYITLRSATVETDHFFHITEAK